MDLEQSPDADAVCAALRAAFAGDERVGAALLFGSLAKGVARPGSDVDVALVASGPGAARALRAELGDLGAALSLAIGRDVHLVLLDAAHAVLGRQVFAHGRRILDRDPQRTARCLERILIAYCDGEVHRRMMGEALDARLAARGRS